MVLAAGAAKRYHEAGKAATAIAGYAGIDEGRGVRKKLADGFLGVEVADNGRVKAG